MTAAPVLDLAADSRCGASVADQRTALDAAIERACGSIAPLWPLQDFVAVNPFLGFTGQSFAATCATLQRVAGIGMLMPRGFYRQALDRGEIGDVDLAAAIASLPAPGVPAHPAALRRLLVAEGDVPSQPPRVVTVAEVLDRLAQGDRRASRTAFMVDEIARWCAAHFDEGQAVWQPPPAGDDLYAAWRTAMRHDLNPEAMGVRGFRRTVASMPVEPRAAIAEVVDRLGIPTVALRDYLVRALLDIGGWAGFVRRRVWTAALDGREDSSMVELLAIRLVWGYALFASRDDEAFAAAWREAMQVATRPAGPVGDGGLAVDLVLHEAWEHARRRRLLAPLRNSPAGAAVTPALQAAFCIDVRSEVYRRALETVMPEAETLGFAGFFGVPLEYVRLGEIRGTSQCPVLLKPSVTIAEGAVGGDEGSMVEGLRLRRRLGRAWTAFRASAVACFAYVETAGLLAAGALLRGALAAPAKAPPAPATAPRLEPCGHHGRRTGLDGAQRLALAESILRGMSLTGPFARLLLLCGHAGNVVNNPHAAGLDCGACGGHGGEVNARVAAALLNDPEVRAGLRQRGIPLGAETWVLAGLHDTTTDRVTLCDEDRVPATHRPDLARLRLRLDRASALARLERAPALGIGRDEEAHGAIGRRARDWAQVRPEWGLAGNALFIAAPRSRTRGVDLAGRAFLHSYDWRRDDGFTVLELIMTAPMVVASWINLQYYGSTVNNAVFGSGNKVLHNVVGRLGVIEGNAGDLRTGLPWQSLHDGRRLVHEPLRLSVLIEAPEAAIEGVLARHAAVRDLVVNRWVHLHAIGDDGSIRRYAGGRWEAAAGAA